jgi:putative sigma-54 modulation protein
LPIELEEESGEEPRHIVRVKRFPMTPMHAEEAVEQMELLGHDFFVFFNAEEGQINVLYRRKDGDYGLLQPELQ